MVLNVVSKPGSTIEITDGLTSLVLIFIENLFSGDNCNKCLANKLYNVAFTDIPSSLLKEPVKKKPEGKFKSG